VLGNGFRIHADRHETDGSLVRLYEGGGVTQIGSDRVDHFEVEDSLVTPEPGGSPAAGQKPCPTKLQESGQAAPEELARLAAGKYGLPEEFVRSVMRVESALRQEAISPKGAIGLMQLMPETARTLGVDPRNAKENAEGGAQYLRDLLARYENRPDQVLLALAAYNAGPGAVDRYHGVPPYAETRQYILKVLKYWEQTRKAD